MKVLIKIGGALVDDAGHRAQLARQIVSQQTAQRTSDRQFVVVHGGGRQLTRFLEERGVPSRFVNGLRVTSEEAMDAVVKVLAGSVNTHLTGALRAAGASAVGLSGLDAHLTTAVALSSDLGRVGRVAAVDASVLDLLTLAGHIPVVACVGGDDSGLAWNINADQMASAVAAAFPADRLVFLTDVAGVMDQSGAVLPSLNLTGIAGLIESGVATGGMQAKLEAAAAAVLAGVPSVVIAAGAQPDVLERLFRGAPVGTEIRR